VLLTGEDGLVQALGYELGGRATPLEHLDLAAAIWLLDLDSELTFSGDGWGHGVLLKAHGRHFRVGKANHGENEHDEEQGTRERHRLLRSSDGAEDLAVVARHRLTLVTILEAYTLSP
jgi:hypothetical protein